MLSVLRLPLDQDQFQGFAHKGVEVDDVDDENLLEHFPSCNNFIQDGLAAGGGVLVHWSFLDNSVLSSGFTFLSGPNSIARLLSRRAVHL